MKEHQFEQTGAGGEFRCDGEVSVDPGAELLHGAVRKPLFEFADFDCLEGGGRFLFFPAEPGGERGAEAAPHLFAESAAGEKFRHGRIGGERVQCVRVERIQRVGKIENAVRARRGERSGFEKSAQPGGIRIFRLRLVRLFELVLRIIREAEERSIILYRKVVARKVIRVLLYRVLYTL